MKGGGIMNMYRVSAWIVANDGQVLASMEKDRAANDAGAAAAAVALENSDFWQGVDPNTVHTSVIQLSD
jgi:hypothetical protein